MLDLVLITLVNDPSSEVILTTTKEFMTLGEWERKPPTTLFTNKQDFIGLQLNITVNLSYKGALAIAQGKALR